MEHLNLSCGQLRSRTCQGHVPTATAGFTYKRYNSRNKRYGPRPRRGVLFIAQRNSSFHWLRRSLLFNSTAEHGAPSEPCIFIMDHFLKICLAGRGNVIPFAYELCDSVSTLDSLWKRKHLCTFASLQLCVRRGIAMGCNAKGLPSCVV